MSFATRFAPSPTGYLHRGHAFSALTAFRAAQEAGGRFVLRIEDIDATRSRPEYEAAILEDLTWLGLDWERPVRRQSQHLTDYHAAIETLRERGLVYRCFKTRKELDIGRAPHEPAVAYRGAPLPKSEEAERLARGEAFAWRLSFDAAEKALCGFSDLSFVEQGAGPDGETGEVQARPETAGDIVLARKDVGVAYHLAVVLDDALQGITHVIRGVDLFEAAHIQRLLQALLHLPTPVYRHHRLLVGPDGRRYAKRDKAQTLQELRAAGVTPQALRAEMGL
ncbi:tRNA glutamyl-Q(34) synthetase GluQRS [Caulobacter endophyticus]|uniref:tRNA glutamyl-Q(34) synthetase GluQRS n=1 Tax=Caulobacter endophyticus TaxID=2172652 RepID=A0A2T9K7Q3_9CAUL|nr:tRNA glutamyl-Q(34) synthetase GluQRS [Caulobacter endophyticus]PVM91979.1 tRNA glutamyl-Q(34) synthetase GluQRS [Caulobacter endophyticus]